MSSAEKSIAQLTVEQRALLEARLLGQMRPRAPLKAADQGPKPLSPAQESLWFFDGLVPSSPLYNIPQAFRLRGQLHRAALENAFTALFARQSALRTRFSSVDGQAVQEPIAREFSLDFVDLAHLSEEQREHALAERLQAEAQRPFQLTRDPMLRACLVRLAPEVHALTISLHHIVSDFASLQILYRELDTFYADELERRAHSLPSLTLSFASWAAQQHQIAQAQAPALAYWKGRLSGNLPVLEMPSDRPRPLTRSFRGARRPWALSARLTAALHACSQQEGVTLYVLLLAGWQTLLHRYSRQEDILIGTPASYRSTPETQQLIGYMLNTVVLRSDLSGNPGFRDLLQRVRERVIEALAHQELPFESLVELLRIPRQAGMNPLCQVMFQYLPMDWPRPKLLGVSAEPLPMETGTAKFDLTLTALENGGQLCGDLEFSTDLFDAPTIDRLLQHWAVLLEGVVANPSARIADLPLLTAPERNQVLITWNQTASDYPRQSCIHELFQEQARSRPQSVAVIDQSQTITYEGLNRRANQLARVLLQRGVAPGGAVALCIERSPAMLIGLLAILKAGAAYIPLDPKSPAERLQWMLADSGASLLLNTSDTSRFQPVNCPVLTIDSDPAAFSKESDADLASSVTADDLAYIIYTSGSTGQPKGVAVPHRGVVRLVKNTNYARLDPSEVFLQFAPLAFDASTFEIWGALLNGAKLVIYPPDFESLEQLVEVIERHEVTTLWLTAGLFQQVVEQHLDRLRTVRQLLAGGDVLPVPQVKAVLARLPHCQLINGYGPTENTTFTCCYPFPRDWSGTASAPIGRPISNTQVYLLDPALGPVPVGVPGELYIGGDGLARGYVSSPELTAQKFIPNPWNPQSRLYRTGDQARYLADGTIEFLGRLDDQVKINGFRIHLSEVEAALQGLPGVHQAAVVAVRTADGSKQLAAYVVAQNSVTPTECRVLLSDKLPAYMIPNHIHLHQALPLTANGKLNRAALLTLDCAPVESTTPPATAFTPDQETIAQIWREVFARQDIGLDDNFFDLGGHSLLATRVLSRLNKAFQSEVSLATLFSAPTIRGLAERTAKRASAPSSGPIQRRQRPSQPLR